MKRDCIQLSVLARITGQMWPVNRTGTGDGEHGRPYWLHQVAEYIVGFILLLAVSRVDGAERVPLIIGGALVLVNAAISGPPAGCLHLVPRRVHRWTDVGVIAALVVIPLVFRDDAPSTVWIAMCGSAVVLAVIRLTTDYRVPVPRKRVEQPTEPATPASTTNIARTAGKAVRVSPRALGRAIGKTQRPPG